MSLIILIPHIKVQSANLQTSGLLLGGCPLMATSMFTHNLARQLGVIDEGVILIHHDRQDLGSFVYGRFTPAQRRGAVFINKNDYSSKNQYALSLQPTASCHLHFSLILQVDEGIDSDDIVKLMNNSRFAGGKILEFGEIKVLPSDNLYYALNSIKTGYVIIDRQDVLLNYQKRMNINRLQAFTELLALSRDGLNHVFGDNHHLAWLSATNLGYALLEPATHDRTGVRQAYDLDGTPSDTPHAYAEPLIGLVQYVSLNQLLNQQFHPSILNADDNTIEREQENKTLTSPNAIAEPLRQLSENLDGLWWRYEWQPHDGGDVFLLTQNR